MASNESKQAENTFSPSQETSLPISSVDSEDSVAMSINTIDITNKTFETLQEPAQQHKPNVPKIGISPKALEKIIYRILSEAEGPLWWYEIIDILKEEITDLEFTREYITSILTSSKVIRTYTPFALFTFIPSKRQRAVKLKKIIQKTKSNLDQKWDKWMKKDITPSSISSESQGVNVENENTSLPLVPLEAYTNMVASTSLSDDIIKSRLKKCQGRPIGSTNKTREEERVNEKTANVESNTRAEVQLPLPEEALIPNNEQEENLVLRDNPELTSEALTDEDVEAIKQLHDAEAVLTSTNADNLPNDLTESDLVKTDVVTGSVQVHDDTILDKDTSHGEGNNIADEKITAEEENVKIDNESHIPVVAVTEATSENISESTLSSSKSTSKTKVDKEKKPKGKKTKKESGESTETSSETANAKTKKRKKSKDTTVTEGSKHTEYNLFSEFESESELNLFSSIENNDKVEEPSLPSLLTSLPSSEPHDSQSTEKPSSDKAIIVESVNTPTTQDMNISNHSSENQNTPIGNNIPSTPLLPPHTEEVEDEVIEGKEIARFTDERTGMTIIVNRVDPSTLSDENREWLEKYEHDRLTKTPDQIEREKTRAAKRKAMGEGTTAFVTSLKTRGSRKTVAIDKKSWGSLFD